MAQQALRQEDIPKGGIADFIMADEDFAYLEAANAEKQFGNAGIAKFDNVARRMASYGRYGDDLVAHVETGEIVVPKRLIEKSPELKESIFQHLRDQGVTEPERYVVGSSDNSINPETGLREFGFFSDIFNGVKKVLKSVAGVALPVLGSLVFGPIYGAALGSGVATLIQGGNIGDALKAGVTAGALGGFGSFASGALKGGMSGGIASLGKAARFSNLGQGFKNIANVLQPGGFKTAFNMKNMAEGPSAVETDQSELFSGAKDFYSENISPSRFDGTSQELLKTELDKAKTLFPELTSTQHLELAQNAVSEAAPNFLQKYGPIAAVGTAGAAALGAFKTPEQQEIETITGQDLIDENEEKFLVQNLAVVPSQGPYESSTIYNTGLADINPPNSNVNPFIRPQSVFEEEFVTTAADGGEIFPRRIGGIMPDEGIPNEDSVRAMVMPGEFIMTTDAVKGAGGGNLKKGIQNMYSVMRNLENRAGSMA
jgi:hypothetical protein